MLGAKTELDHQILQAIKDPLTHMIRNWADQGNEEPSARKAAGKPEVGQNLLRAFHKGGHIVIEIQDDGKGLDVEALREKAVARGLVAPGVAADLPRHRSGGHRTGHGRGRGQGRAFAVPQIGVLELVGVADENRHLIEDVNGSVLYSPSPPRGVRPLRVREPAPP